MFGLGMGEIMVILVVALLVLGPQKLPDAAKQIGKAIRELRKHTQNLQETIEQDEHIGGTVRELKSALRGDEIWSPPKPRTPVPEAEKAVAQNQPAAAEAAPAAADASPAAPAAPAAGPAAPTAASAAPTATEAAPAVAEAASPASAAAPAAEPPRHG
jgi:sec-independent protein translocase protein TatB